MMSTLPTTIPQALPAAVLAGRLVLHGLANSGAEGVAPVMRLLRDELEIAMALTGYRYLSDCAEMVDTGHRLPPA